ncbi:stabilizer of axonemal microtubules 1-like [Ylistrum balloti]|uniref:stabilizer of axonemal microtubules 1-like n=1 Tax=Ylistrum balloti TaxID=509963 RepID=UPI002905B7E5|nr:stabilizer of axonemal microtubules 1-like [Ylistrum balloti]
MSVATAVASSKRPQKARNRSQIPAWDARRSGLKLTQTQSDGRSEYQASYTKWPFQRPRTNIKPESNHLEIPASICDMDMDTTYRTDYVVHEASKREKKKEYVYRTAGGVLLTDTTYKVDFAPKVALRAEPFKTYKEYSAPVTKFKGKSIYQMSYQHFEPDLAKQCRPSPIRPAEALKSGEHKATPASTFRNDYQKHENTVKRKPIKQEENNKPSTEPLESTTSYKEFYTKKELPTYSRKVINTNCVVTKMMLPEALQPKTETTGDSGDQNSAPAVESETKETNAESPVQGLMTTFMADFRPHYNVRRRTMCKPPESDYHFIDAPFDGNTTAGIAYKVWPVAFPEKPHWTVKPPYKRPQTFMQTDSTYAVDFKHPGSNLPPSLIKNKHNQDIIRHVASGDAGQETTYQNNFKGIPLEEATKSFLFKQEYEPPKERMICQSTQRAHYTGNHSERAKLCRQISEHRTLFKNQTMEFGTTYRDTYKDNRPKSCPANVKLSLESVESEGEDSRDGQKPEE